MSQSAKQLLIIYEAEAEQWASYLQSVFTGPISESGICCYDITRVCDDFADLSQFTCKLLILSKGMMEALSPRLCFVLARVLSPAAGVVVLLCGVDSLTPLLDLVPLNECLQISSEQDANEYLSAVTDIVRKGVSPTANVDPVTCSSSGSRRTAEQSASVVVVPPRVPCGSCVEVFILLKNQTLSSDTQLEFSGENHTLRVTPARWNERTLCVSAPDFAAGQVRVTVHSDGAALGSAQLQYCSSTEELAQLLSRLADPVHFMCQALQVSSVEKLDHRLASMLLEAMPSEGFQGLPRTQRPERELHREDLPSLLHFAARFGLKSVSSLLLQCPGAERALHTANRHGRTPAEVAHKHGHTELHLLLKETLKTSTFSAERGDASVYEIMCTAGTPSTTDVQEKRPGEEEEEEEGQEDLYAPLGVNDEYDIIVKAAKAAVITNRPPAPTPRPESTGVDDKTPYIAQVFQKKKPPQAGADLYSLPTKQARGRDDGALVPNQAQRLKAGSADGAPERVRPQAQRSTDGSQQETPSQLRASGIISTDDGVYDKINVVHHSPSAAGNKNRRRNKSLESDFYSAPLKGQHSNFFWKADKR